MRAIQAASPNSTDLTAGMEKSSWLTTLSTEPKNGEPMPAGTPTAAHSMTPPTLSQSARASATRARMASSRSGASSGKRLSCRRSSVARSTFTASKGVSSTLSMAAMCAPMVMPRRASSCRAMLPAKTSGAVMRPEKCPPPRGSLKPMYLTLPA